MSRRDTVLKHFEEQKDFVNDRVKNGIEKYRKTDADIKIIDKSGSPVKGAKVEVIHTNHEFRHGMNIFMLDEFETEEKNEIYRKKFPEIANLATVPIYWSDLEPEKGKPRYAKDSPKVYRRPATDLCVEYCKENGIEPKCHCLFYDPFTPEWLRGEDLATMKKYLEGRMESLATNYADKIPSWEVTNETLNYMSYKPTPLYNDENIVEWCFEKADSYFPKNRLIINDYAVWENWFIGGRSPYYRQVERLFDKGIRHLDAVGFQLHFFFPQKDEEQKARTRYNPEHLYAVMDRYEKLGLPLQITEMTISAYSNSEEDEDIQAELLKGLYSVFFSHPAMEAAIYWNLVDGYAVGATAGDMTAGENIYHGGLLRFDMSEKPAYKALRDLFRKQWHTEENGATDDGGHFAFRGFYGDYDVKIILDGKEETRNISLSKNSDNNITIIV